MARGITVTVDPTAMLKAVAAGGIAPELAAIFMTPAEKKRRKGKPCPITADEFLMGAPDLDVEIAGLPSAVAKHQQFGTGTLGWAVQFNKLTVRIGDVDVPVNGSFSLYVSNSKPETPPE